MEIKYSKENLEKIIKESNSIKECLIKLDRPTSGDNYNFLKRKIKKYSIDVSHFLSTKELMKIAAGDKWFSSKYTLDEILSEDFQGEVRGNSLKTKLYKAELKQPICELCGQDENWRGKKMSMIVDHINGINNDNRLENLRIVCPNCDATLDTFKGKNRASFKNKNIKINKKEQQKQEIINNILNSGVDFFKKGWGTEISKILNKSPQYSIKWVKINMSNFYKNCFKHIDNTYIT